MSSDFLFKRRSLRLQGYDYGQCGAYFVTVCVNCRKHLFGRIENGKMVLNDVGLMVEKIWNELPTHYLGVEIDEHIVMPDHFHGIVVITNPTVGAIHELPLHESKQPMTRLQRRNMTLPKLIGRFKMLSAKHINIVRNTRGNPVWQRNYYEHIIRNEKSLNQLREYILLNPTTPTSTPLDTVTLCQLSCRWHRQ